MLQEKEAYFDKALKWAERKGFSDIKANSEEHETPKKYMRQKGKEEEAFVPDLSGRKLGSKSFIEIALKSDNMRRSVTKWKLLSTLAAMKRGKLYLLAPHGHRKYADDLIKQHNISAQVVSIR